MNAVVSQRKEVKLQPNTERPCALSIETLTGSHFCVYAYSQRKVRGVLRSSLLATAHAAARECVVHHSLPKTSASGYQYREQWSLWIGNAYFSVTKAEADRITAELGLSLETIS